MTRLSQRCARVLRVRSIEHQVAAASQAAAERRVAELLGVASRLGDLRSSLRSEPGPTDGQSLHAMAEMSDRLRRAAADLAQPISAAEARHEEALSARLQARTREDGAGRLRDRAAASEMGEATLREDANRAPRLTKRRRG